MRERLEKKANVSMKKVKDPTKAVAAAFMLWKFKKTELSD